MSLNFSVTWHGSGRGGFYGLLLLRRYHSGCFGGPPAFIWAGTVKSCIVHALQDGTASNGKKTSGVNSLCGNMLSTQVAVHGILLHVAL